MTIKELIYRRKQDVGRRKLAPGTARVYWHGYEGDHRGFTIIIPTDSDLLCVVTGTCTFDEKEVTSSTEWVDRTKVRPRPAEYVRVKPVQLNLF
jgi:hypothetical protein